MAADFQRSFQALANAATELNAISMAHNNRSTEVARFPQAPAIQVQQIIARLDAVGLQMQAGYYNTSCMIANQQVRQPDTLLRPLRNVATNQPIPNFPHSLRAVEEERRVNTFRNLMIALGDEYGAWSLARYTYLEREWQTERGTVFYSRVERIPIASHIFLCINIVTLSKSNSPQPCKNHRFP